MFNVFVVMANRLPRETELFHGNRGCREAGCVRACKKSLSVLGVTEDGHFCFL